MRKWMIALISIVLIGAPATLAAQVKIGMITTLSGGGSALGVAVRDGFKLAVDQEGGKLGGIAVELLVEDDARKSGKALQVANRFMKRDKVDIMTGIIWSNLAIAVVPKVGRGRRLLHQPQRRAFETGRQGLPSELLQRRLAERQPARGHGTARGPGRIRERLHPGAQLPGREGCAPRLQAFLQGQAGRRSVHEAGADGLRGRDRGTARRQAGRGLLLPARGHGHQLPQAVPPGGPDQEDPAVRTGVLLRPDHPGRRGRRRRAGRDQTRPSGTRTSTTRPTRRSWPASRRRTSGFPPCTPARATTPRA